MSLQQRQEGTLELCALIPRVIVTKSTEAAVELGHVLGKKWDHVIPEPSAFESELVRCMGYWKRQGKAIPSISTASLLETHADKQLFPNVRELLQILVSCP